MKKVLLAFAILCVLLVSHTAFASQTSQADMADEFQAIRILDDIMVFVDVEGDGLDADALRTDAIAMFKKYMRGMEVNTDAVVDNYPSEGYKLENVGYIIMKVMDIRTASGLNVYHLSFEFGIPPREVYWDTATMGVAPTTLQLKKEVYGDVDEIMKEFAESFYKLRGE